MRVLVLHRGFGCETGCCGHIVEVDGQQVGSFEFEHPYGEDFRKFAEDLVTAHCGVEHVKDLDWEHCIILDGMNC